MQNEWNTILHLIVQLQEGWESLIYFISSIFRVILNSSSKQHVTQSSVRRAYLIIQSVIELQVLDRSTTPSNYLVLFSGHLDF